MRETLIAGGILASLLSLGAMAMFPFETLFRVGTVLIVAGFAFGLPPAVVYHVNLYRALKPRDALPSNWIWDPIRATDFLTRRERRQVVPWMYAGGAGFVVIALGLVAWVGALVSVFAQQ